MFHRFFFSFTALLLVALLSTFTYLPCAYASANGTSGGVIKYTQSISENASTTIAENANYVLLHGPAAGSEARITVNINAGAVNDDWILQFAGECRLFGSDESSDYVDVQIRFDGAAVQPLNGGSPLGFCSDDNYEAHSITAIVEHVTSGTHTVEVYWRARDNSPLGTLTAWIDDWSFLLMVSD